MINSLLPRTLLIFIALSVVPAGGGADDDDDDDGDPPSQVPSGGETGSGGPGTCQGSATPCELLSADFCIQSGCRQGAFCAGTVTDCASFSSAATCAGVAGCNWQVNRCRGASTSCASWASKSECGGHTGCSWREGCTGTTRVCAQQTALATCGFTPGCKWVPDQ